MSHRMFFYEYPVALVPEEDEGGFVVTFPDFPEAITQGESIENALEEAEDCLEEAVANRIAMNLDLPIPRTPEPGQAVVAVPTATAVKAAFYTAIRELNSSKVQVAALLGVDEREVRRLLDPYHPSKLNRIQELLRTLGKRIVLRLEDVQPSAVETKTAPSESMKSVWNAREQNRGNLYVLPSRQKSGSGGRPDQEVAS